ncbi:MAG: ligand-binding sensor domain-containing protein, partial [Roseimicrobium sp.]
MSQKPRRYLLAVLCMILGVGHGEAQDKSPDGPGQSAWRRQPWQTDDGLPNNDVTGILQMPDGSMLMSTLGGISRLDGRRFRPAPLQGLTQDARVLGMCFGKGDSVWAALRSRIVRFHRDAPPDIVPARVLPAEGLVSSMFEDREGAVWVSFDTPAVFRIVQGQISTPPLPEAATEGFTAVALDEGGVVWAAGPGVLARWEGGKWNPVAVLPSLKACLCAARGGGVWVGSGKEVLRYTAEKGLESKCSIRVDKLGARIARLLEDSSSRLWIGCHAVGLFCWAEDGLSSVEVQNQDVWALCEDRERNLWVGTGGGGAWCVRKSVVQLFRGEQGLENPTPRSMCLDVR